ncbi:hypothetical protein [Marinobacter sp.]|uniref:hypothetical protein n=1 Tax=Marinobacter sp. TaxID=50741 RepID=UPI00384E2AF0
MRGNSVWKPGGAVLSTALIFACLWSSAAWSQDNIMTIEGARIRGDQESPTVLYLVPWQPPAVESLEPTGASFMVEQSIQPLERPSFQRLVSYHERFSEIHGLQNGNAAQGDVDQGNSGSPQ